MNCIIVVGLKAAFTRYPEEYGASQLKYTDLKGGIYSSRWRHCHDYKENKLPMHRLLKLNHPDVACSKENIRPLRTPCIAVN